jgi:amino acid transporter
MAGAKKFGAFAGVFTPSILTILGVIMYMRMGWVVGNAGLWGSILIVLVAHIISVTTGLSVSSIATDKKVGAGGIYYVLSRSMGLPIGGAIGLTLFVGTALSIALYLVGFAESFNAYLGLEMTINGYRITGSVALLALVLIAMISTSVALKTQFFILAAIIISLVSIFAGSRDFIPEVIPSFGGADSVAMTEVFAIFFPAVTGFTAGVAMSGDLKDPKKAIPVGTIAAVAVGFVVYIGLTFFLAYTIDAETLRSDYNILFKIALFAPAVVAGIWGATLSSALGGILGAPRILQAMSVDTITPAFLGKGKGKSNEPWNALILCALIAEAGILIGELDVIARVVSMFYLTAYGFINLAFFLESWAGSDFVPTFKVSRWVGLVGFVATFMVMFQLDMLAMFIAFLIIAGIYLWLVRKELSLGTGDIWNSVWTSVVKTGLQRMDVSEEHKRNWKPNILLFSGGTHQRPHLLEFADSLTGKSGIATNFDLIETPEAAVLFPKHKQATTDKELQKYGMFGRRQEVKNVYDGVETIASTYGFSGIEPNTILMGWAKNTRNPVFFAQMTQKLIDLDYNVLYLDYDRRFGFRDYGTIDLWWRDISNNAELMLSLTRFILKSNKWRHARLRILLVNNENIEHQLIEVRVRNILEQFRMRADIRIINNAVEKISIYQLMRVHSSEAALVMLGVPDIKAGKEASFVERTNDLVGVIGTTLLVKASSYFDKTDLGLREIKAKPVRATDIPEPESLKIPDDEKLESTIRALDSRLELAADHFAKNVLSPVSGCYLKMIETARVEVEKLFSQIEENPLAENAYPLLSGQVEKLQQISKATREAELDTLYELFNKGLGQLLQERTEILNEAPRAVYLKNEKGANAPQRFRSERKKVQWRKRLEYYLRTQAIRKLKTVLLNNGMRHFTFLYDYSKLVENKLLLMLSHLSQAENETPEAAIAEAKASSLQLLDNLQQEALNFEQFTLNELKSADREWCNQLSREVDASMNGRKAGKRKEKDNQRVYRKLKRSVAAYPLFWHRNQSLLHKTFENELELRKLSLQLDQVSGRIEAAVQLHLFQKLETRLAELQNAVQQTAVLVDAEDWGSIDIGAFRIEGESFLDPEDILPTLSAQAEQLTTSLPGSLEVFSGGFD